MAYDSSDPRVALAQHTATMPLLERISELEAALRSIATILGWENVPPLETLERDLVARRWRMKATEDALQQAQDRIDALTIVSAQTPVLEAALQRVTEERDRLREQNHEAAAKADRRAGAAEGKLLKLRALMAEAQRLHNEEMERTGNPPNTFISGYGQAAAAGIIERAEAAEARLREVEAENERLQTSLDHYRVSYIKAVVRVKQEELAHTAVVGCYDRAEAGRLRAEAKLAEVTRERDDNAPALCSLHGRQMCPMCRPEEWTRDVIEERADLRKRAEAAEAQVRELQAEGDAANDILCGDFAVNPEAPIVQQSELCQNALKAVSRVRELRAALEELVMLCRVWGFDHHKQATDARALLARTELKS